MDKSFNEEVLERLTRIETKFDIVQKTQETQEKINDKVDKRLRFLEKGLWMLLGAVALIEIYAKFIHKS